MLSLSPAARRGAVCAVIFIAALLTTSSCGQDTSSNDSGDRSAYGYTDELTDEPTEEPTEEPTSEPAEEPTEEPIEPVEASVPDSVVGVWCGGSNAEGHWTYEFSSTGEFIAHRGGAGFSGVVVSDSRSMTFHVPGESPFVSSWEVVQDPVLGPLLFLDGYSYLPGSCNS
ncbi:PT domain-containing protein [Streptomyces werraensis]|uniref:PT domain-containing protein n=1 Tax=Streptomyces werraensis TaxID=68284 RepID=UPI00332FBD96